VSNIEQIAARWCATRVLEDEIIDKARVRRTDEEIKYAVKLVAGKAVDDAKLEPVGKAGNGSVVPCSLQPHAWSRGVHNLLKPAAWSD
jgi:hypothetical protein